MNKLFTVFSIIFISLNISNLSANQQNLKEHIRNEVWNNNLFNVFKNIAEISNKFENNPYERETYFYAMEILTRMVNDEIFKTQFILSHPCYKKMRPLLLHHMSFFKRAYDEYSNNNDDFDELLRGVLSIELLQLGYDENTDDFNEYAEKCLNLYNELRQ